LESSEGRKRAIIGKSPFFLKDILCVKETSAAAIPLPVHNWYVEPVWG